MNNIALKFYVFTLGISLFSCVEKEKKCNYIKDYHLLVIKAEIAFEQKKYRKLTQKGKGTRCAKK